MTVDSNTQETILEHLFTTIKQDITKIHEAATFQIMKKSDFFMLMDVLPQFAQNGVHRKDISNICTLAIHEANRLHKETNNPMFATWATQLQEYAATFEPGGGIINLGNILMQKEFINNPRNIKQLGNKNIKRKRLIHHSTNENAKAAVLLAKLYYAIDQELSDLDNNEMSLSVALHLATYNKISDDINNIASTMDELIEHIESRDLLAEKVNEFYIDIKNKINLEDFDENVKPQINSVLVSLQQFISKLNILKQLQATPELLPYLAEELTKPQYQGKDIEELIDLSFNDHGEITEGSLYLQALHSAKIALKEKGNLPAVRFSSIANLKRPTAKIASDLFTELILATSDKNEIPGQFKFAANVPVEKPGTPPRNLRYSIIFNEFSDVNSLKALSGYDRRVYEAIGTLYDAGETITLYPRIFAQMGNDTKNFNSDIENRISKSLNKYAASWFEYDQSEDYKPYWKDSIIGLKYKGQLLYFEEITVSYYGKPVKAIHILRPPVLFTLASDRKQITSIPLEVLQTGKRQTDNYLELENYVLERIAIMKNDKNHFSNRIKYDSFYQALNMTGNTSTKRSRRNRALKTLYELLDHYKAVGWIKSYKESENKKKEPGVDIFF